MLRLVLSCLALLCAARASAQSTWTTLHGGGAGGEFLWGITDGPEGPVAVGTNGRILHSPDNAAWETRVSGTTDWLVAVTFGNGRYVAVGDRGTILVSPDAIGWSRATASGTSARLNNVVFAQGRFVAVGEAGVIVTSTDGLTWASVNFPSREPTPLPPVGWLRGLAFQTIIPEAAFGAWTATGQGGVFFTSLNGTDWVRQFGASVDLEAVAGHHAWRDPVVSVYFGGQFLAVGAPGETLGISYAVLGGFASFLPTRVENGVERSGTGSTMRLRSLTFGNGVFIATGENGAVLSAPAASGPWTRIDVGTTKNLVNASYVQGALVLVGEGETILRSEVILSSRLRNVSTRGRAGTGATALIAGTVVQGSRPKQMLVRAAGPALTQFGVPGALADPVLRVFNASNTLVATNSGWSSNPNAPGIAAAASASGAFSFPPNSRDAALLLTLPPGAYTFAVSGANGAPGTALVEAYDVDTLDRTASRTVNLSTRGEVGGAAGPLIVGLVVDGPAARTVLVRGIGPTLAEFGVPGTLADPLLRVLDRNGTTIATNDNWSTATVVNGRTVEPGELRGAAALCGAFDLTPASKDAALLVTLPPGNYTIVASGADDGAGVALVEAYEVPPGASPAVLPLSPVDGAFTSGVVFAHGAPVVAAEQADGRIVLGGAFTALSGGRTTTGLVRIEADGSPDPSFAPPAPNNGGIIKTIALQPDGKILVGGTFTSLGGAPSNRIARLNADGAIDASFVSGYARNTAEQIVVDTAGRIVATDGSSLVRLTATGEVDPAWRGGSYAFAYGSGAQISALHASLRRIAALPDGRIAAAGAIAEPGIPLVGVPPRSYSVLVVFKAADGTIDNPGPGTRVDSATYGYTVHDVRAASDGRIVVRDAPAGISAVAGAVASDGSSWLAGPFPSVANEPRLHLARFRPNGLLAGFRLTAGFLDAAGAPAPPAGLLALRNGDVLAFGPFTQVDGVIRRQLARLHPE